MESIAVAIVLLVEIYAAVGLVFAVAFVTVGVGRIDHGTQGAPWGFRALILPASAALWPLLAWRWIRGREPAEERNSHRLAARGRSNGDEP